MQLAESGGLLRRPPLVSQRKDAAGMGYFPLFIDLTGKPVLIVGGGTVAERKLRTLLGFGALPLLVSPQATAEIRRSAESGNIRYREREYRTEDIDFAVLAVAATGDETVNRQIYKDAVRKGIPVNVVDAPALCTFFFPAVVQRNDFVVGVTTSGSYPALAKYARQQIEMLFPERYGEMTEVLKKFRKKVRKEIQNPAEREKILEKLLRDMVAQETQTAEKGKTAEASGTTPEGLAEKRKILVRKGE